MEPLGTRGFSAADMPKKKVIAKKPRVRAFKSDRVRKVRGLSDLCVKCWQAIEPDRLAMRSVRNVYEKEGTEEMTYPLVIVGVKVSGPTTCAACAEEETPEDHDGILRDFDWGDWEASQLHADIAFDDSPSPIPGEAAPRATRGGKELRARLTPSGYERQRENDRGCRDAGRRDFESPTETKGIRGAAKVVEAASEVKRMERVNQHAGGSI